MRISKRFDTDIPVITLVDSLIEDAIQKRASDIHLEVLNERLRVRFRIDGILYDVQSIDIDRVPSIFSRIKICAKINIAQQRIPQDGKFSVNIDNQTIDLRVSTFPAVNGEKIVIRILNRAQQKIDLEHLGMHPDILHSFKELLLCSSGFFLVTGPTGAGKTTTLYAALSELNSHEKNIITLEDPVEYNLEGITQGHIRPDVGFTFQQGIRAILRQDPDVAMIGEIRDIESAEIAIEAALSGHLIFSTLHTNDAPSTIIRLLDMGIEPFLINAAISGVLAQRLARTICRHCIEEYIPTDAQKEILEKYSSDISRLYKGTGCHYCLDLGYRGRVGIFELCILSSTLQELIMHRPLRDTLYKCAQKEGMRTLTIDGLEKVKQGLITLEEFVRAIS